MTSRRCVQSLNQIGQQEGTETGRRKRMCSGCIFGQFQTVLKFEFRNTVHDIRFISSRSVRIQNMKVIRKQELGFRRARKSAIL